MGNILRLKKGNCLPHQDLLELEFGAKLLQKSMLMKLYTEDENVVKQFQEHNSGGYFFRRGDGAFLLDDDYEIVIRRVSKKRQERESAGRINKYLESCLQNK